MAAGGFAQGEVGLTAAQKAADGGAPVVDDLDGASVGDGDRVLGDVETHAVKRGMMQEGHDGAILSRLSFGLFAGVAISGPINSPSVGARRQEP